MELSPLREISAQGERDEDVDEVGARFIRPCIFDIIHVRRKLKLSIGNVAEPIRRACSKSLGCHARKKISKIVAVNKC